MVHASQTASGSMPHDLSSSLVFTATGLGRLQNRITQLQEEKAQLRSTFKDYKKNHKALTKELQHKQELIDLEKKVHSFR